MPKTRPLWVVDLSDPRAPPQEIWDAMTPEERTEVIDALPSEFDLIEAMPPEGDGHFVPKIQVRDTVESYFRRTKRPVYLGSELAVYYPGEKVFAPDLIAVLDVSLHWRDSWVVAVEGKGPDFALEIMYRTRPKKDLEQNRSRYSRLGIPEYFVFDSRRMRLNGFRLRAGGGYDPILPQSGRFQSAVLGLELGIEGNRLRFYHSDAMLPDSAELIARLEGVTSDLWARAEAAEQRAEAETQRAEAETQRADAEALARAEAERRLAAALARLAELERS